jgi:hypothetical protein
MIYVLWREEHVWNLNVVTRAGLHISNIISLKAF